MSNIRLNTIVPDLVGTINLPGSLNVTSLSSLSVLDATSVSSASITTLGGLAVTKSVSIGGTIDLRPSSTTGSIGVVTTAGSDNKSLLLTSTGTNNHTRGSSLELNGNQLLSGTARLKTGSSGSFIVQCGTADIANFTSSGLAIYGTSPSTSSTVGSLVLSGGLSITNTTDAISSTNGGGLTVAGGLAVGGSIILGGSLLSTGGITNSAFLHITSTTDSTALEEGSLTTLGGASVSKNLYVGGITNLQNSVNVIGSLSITNTADTSIATAGGITITKVLTVGGNVTANANLSVSGITTIVNSTQSTLPTNGAIVVSGGIGIGKDLSIAGNINAAANVILSDSSSLLSFAGSISGTATTDSSSLSTGTIVTAGGVAIAKSIRIGTNAFISGQATITGSTSLSSLQASGQVSITDTTISTSSSSGALIVSGGLGIGGSTNIAGLTNILSTVEATSSTIGALVVTGGVAVQKSIYVGTNLSVIGTTTLSAISATTVSASGVLTFTDTTQSVSSSTGSALFSGGIGIALNTNIGGNLSVTGSTSFTGNQTCAGILSITNTTDSVSLSTASFVTSGGLSVTKAIRIGTNAMIGGSITVSGTHISLNTTVSTNSSTGALVIAGGIGIGGDCNIGGAIGITGNVSITGTTSIAGYVTISNTTDASSLSTGSFVTQGGIAIAKQLRIGTDLTVSGIGSITGTFSVGGTSSFTNTVEATAYNSASMILAGGLGVAKRVFLNSSLTVAGNTSIAGLVTSADITDSTNASSGSATFAGGVGISRNLNVGGGFSVGASSTFVGSIVNTAGSLTLHTIDIKDISGLLSITSVLPGIRIAATDAAKATQYTNFIDLFSLGNSYIDANHEALQFTTTSTNTFSIMSRNAGTGILRRLVFQSGGSNTGQIILNTDGTVQVGVASAIDSSSPTTGSLMVQGGLGVSKSLSIKSTLRVFGTTSGAVTITTPSTITSYQLTLPSSVAPSANYALVSDTNGVLTWSEMTTANPSFTTVTVSNTDGNSITTAGGITAGSATLTNATLGSNLPILTIKNTAGGAGNTVGIDLIPYGGRVSPPVRLLAVDNGTVDAYFSLRVATGSSISSATEALQVKTDSVYVPIATASTSTTSGALQVAGGVGIVGSLFVGGNVNLAGATGLNQVLSNTNGSAAPTFTSRSNGSRFVIYPALGASSVDYAIGVENSYTWFSTPTSSGNGFKWYAGTSNNMTLFASGSNGYLQLNSGLPLKFEGAISGTVSIIPPATVTSYNLTLPPNLPTSNSYALVSSTTGVLSWSEMTTANPTFTSVNVTGTTPSTGIGTGSLIVAGGLSIGNNLSIKNSLLIAGNTSGTITLQAPDTNDSPVLILPANMPGSGQVLASDGEGQLMWTDMASSTTFSVSGDNNVSSPTTITGMKFSGIFDVDIQVTVTTNSGRTDALYTLRGFPSAAGYSLFTTYTGDDTGYKFYVDPTGQISYTTTNVAGWLGATIKWTGSQTYSASAAGSVPTSVLGSNNVTTPEDVTGLVITGSQLSLYILVTVTATISSSTLYKIEGALQPSGVWQISQQLIGPDREIQFSVTPTGQVQYISSDISGWSSTFFQFYAPPTALVQRAAFQKLTVGNEGALNSGSSFEVETNATIGGNLSVGGTLSSSVGDLYLSMNPTLRIKNVNDIDQIIYNSSTSANCVQQLRHSNRSEIWDCGPDANGSFVVRQNSIGVYLGTGATSWSSLSDRRLKEDVSYLDEVDSLLKIEQLKPVTYKMINDESKKTHFGLVAQEVTDIIPELVDNGPDDKLGLNYTELIPVLLSAIKGLKAQVEELKGRSL